MRRIYVIGSLRNPLVRALAAELRSDGHEAFDDWHAAGPEADDIWQDYEKGRGHSFIEALRAPHAKMVVDFDRNNLLARDTAIMVMPAGKSCHMELGMCIGQGKDTHILMPDEHARWDVMYGLASGVWSNSADLRRHLRASRA